MAVEEPPEPADAGEDAFLRQRPLDLGQRDLLVVGGSDVEDRLGMPLDAVRASVAAECQGTTVALVTFALPPAAKLAALTPNRSPA